MDTPIQFKTKMKKFVAGLSFLFILLSFKLSAQTITLSGYVHSDNAKAIAGASISLKNTAFQTACDSAGNFSLPIKPGRYTIIATAVGYQPADKTITISRNLVLELKLVSDVKQLKDVN